MEVINGRRWRQCSCGRWIFETLYPGLDTDFLPFLFALSSCCYLFLFAFIFVLLTTVMYLSPLTLVIYYILARLPPVIFLISCRYIILLAILLAVIYFIYALNCLPQFYFSRLFLLQIFGLSPLFCICCPSTLHLLFFLPLFLP